MARIVGGSMIGELSGKLGGNVFARNRGGAYIRQYVVPIDPRSIAQQTARAKFGTSASSYHSLNETQKAEWSNFATNVFNPKTGKMGVPSGFNAFVALQNAVLNVKNIAATWKIKTVAAPGTNINFATKSSPPAFGLESTISLSGGEASIFSLANISMTSWSYTLSTVEIPIEILFNVTGEVGTMGDFSATQDAKGNIFGFKIFMSNAVAQQGMFIQNPYLFDLGTVKPISFTASIMAPTSFSFAGTASLETGKYQSIPTSGQAVQISIFQISESGMLLKAGASIITIPE